MVDEAAMARLLKTCGSNLTLDGIKEKLVSLGICDKDCMDNAWECRDLCKRIVLELYYGWTGLVNDKVLSYIIVLERSFDVGTTISDAQKCVMNFVTDTNMVVKDVKFMQVTKKNKHTKQIEIFKWCYVNIMFRDAESCLKYLRDFQPSTTDDSIASKLVVDEYVVETISPVWTGRFEWLAVFNSGPPTLTPYINPRNPNQPKSITRESIEGVYNGLCAAAYGLT